MHAYYLSTMVALLHDRQVTEAQLLAGTGLASVHALQEGGASGAQLDTVCANALALSQDQQFGLRLGSHINISSQGIFGYALMTSPRVGDALKLLLRYSRAIIPSVQIDVLQHAGRVEVTMAADHLPPDLKRFYCEVLFAAIVHNGAMLIGDNTITSLVELDYHAPCDREQYYQIFGSDILFDSERCALGFDAASMDIPITTANPVAQDIFRRECDRLASLDSRRDGVSARVQQLLLRAGSEFPTGAAVARQLNMSESTLQRRLASEGCKYQQLLDQVRYSLANEYLASTTLPVAEIACLLGFSDATNFRRSFKRWSSTTPSVVRREALRVRQSSISASVEK